MAGAAGERKKQVHFARLEEEGGEDRGGGGSSSSSSSSDDTEAPLQGSDDSCSARLVLQPEVIVADGSGRRSRAEGGVAARQQATETAVLQLRRALKWCISAALCAAFLGLGMAIAILGPTFQDLAANVNKNVSQISYIFVGRSMGYFGGSLIGGILVDCMNAHLLLGFSMLGTAVGGNVLALCTWGTEAGPHMQALHFSFALGAFVAPILAKMALGSSASAPRFHLNGTNRSAMNSADTLMLNLQLNWNFVLSYAVIGTYLLFIGLLFFILYLRTSHVQGRTKLSAQKYLTAKYHHALIILLSVFFFCYVGAEVTYGSYIFTYAKTYIGMKENEAAGLNSLFWGAFAACRGLAICFATCSYPGSMILLSIIGSTVSALFLALFNTHIVSLWLGSAVYGASMAAVFPSGISWIEQYTTIEGKSASLFVMGAALGEMCVPAVVGYLQGHFPTLPVLMYAALGAAVMTAVLFPVMYKVATTPCDAKLKDTGDSEVQEALLSNSHLEEDEEQDGREWNEDFEVIEMNDTLRNSVIETSKKIQGECSPATSSHPPSGNASFNSSPLLAAISPRKNSNSNSDRDKND